MTHNEAKQAAKQMVAEAVLPHSARVEKIKRIAEALNCDYAKAESLVKQEESRKEASKRYRESEAYANRLHDQRVVRQMLKGGN